MFAGDYEAGSPYGYEGGGAPGSGGFFGQMFGHGRMMGPQRPSPVAAPAPPTPFTPAPALPGNPNAMASLYGHPTMTLGIGAPQAPVAPPAAPGAVGVRRML